MARMKSPGVFIDSGPITATSTLEEVPQASWYNLMCQRESFVKARLSHDCRCLVQFVADAERMFAPLGFQSADDFIARGLKLVPDEIRLAVDWLKINKPQEAIPIEVVHKLAKHGGDRRSEAVKDQVRNTNLKRSDTRAYILARLERDGQHELAAKVRAGTLSANAAAQQMGWRKRKTPFEIVLLNLPKLTKEERDEVWERLLELK